jgi:hypothetical protein
MRSIPSPVCAPRWSVPHEFGTSRANFAAMTAGQRFTLSEVVRELEIRQTYLAGEVRRLQNALACVARGKPGAASPALGNQDGSGRGR